MKLAIRLGVVVVGLLLLGGAGFVGWRHFRPQEAPAPVAAKGKGEAKPPAAGASKTPTAAVTPSTPGTPVTPQTAPPAPVAQATEKPPAAAQEKVVAPQATPSPPAPTAQAGDKPAGGPQEKAAAAPASRDAEQERLLRVYGNMKPKEAAAVMGQLDPGLSVTILAGLQERQAAKILGLLPPKTAADLVTRLSQIKRAPEADASTRRPPAGGKS